MQHTHLFFFTLEDADTGIREPSYMLESEPDCFEFVPMDNPMDAIDSEEEYREWERQHSLRLH